MIIKQRNNDSQINDIDQYDELGNLFIYRLSFTHVKLASSRSHTSGVSLHVGTEITSPSYIDTLDPPPSILIAASTPKYTNNSAVSNKSGPALMSSSPSISSKTIVPLVKNPTAVRGAFSRVNPPASYVKSPEVATLLIPFRTSHPHPIEEASYRITYLKTVQRTCY